MAFPQTVLPLEVAFQFDGATWTAVTSDVRSEQQIRITRGRGDWGQQVDAGRCTFSLDNATGNYSPRNPEGTHYGQIGRNTPVRVSVLTGDVALWLPGTSSLDTISTPDAAALDITGDIDIRLDATLLNWYLADRTLGDGDTSILTELIGKFNVTGNQRSWIVYAQYGYLKMSWSQDGTSTNGYVASSTEKLTIPSSGRLAVRVTLDVNNGAGGWTARFYTSDSLSGTWTQLGVDVTGGATTSIFNSTASLHIGNALAGAADTMPVGHVHAAEVRNGIGGSAVANPNFTAQTSGTTSFADSAGRTWAVGGSAEITNRKVRFVGEVSSWSPRWDTGGFDVVTDVEAAGVMRRLGQGAVPVKSPMYREFTSPSRQNIVGYWPMEDASGATSLASALDGHPAMSITGSVTPAAYSTWPASDALPTVGTGSLRANVPSYTATSYLFLRVFAAVPAAGVVSTQRLLSFTQTGTATTWSVYVNTSGNLDLRAYDNTGTQILATGFGVFAVNGKQKSVGVELTQDGADIDYALFSYDVADSTLTASSSSVLTGTLAGYTIGRATQVRFGEDGAMNDTAIGHLAIADSSTAFSGTAGALLGWNGESAAERVHRLGVEENIAAYSTAPGDEEMGVQARSTVLDLMRAAGDVDEGILCEQRDILGVRLVQRTSMYNQPVTFTMDYTGDDGLVAPLDPVDDDSQITNDVTVARDGGSFTRTMLDTGALSTNLPPDGIGLYDTSYTLNLHDDAQTPGHAGWRLHLGTWDETRYPQVTVNLANAPASIDDAAALDVGSRMQITNPPSWLPPDTIDLRVEGYSETLDQYTWTLVYNCSPAGPWSVGYVADGTYGRADTDGSETTTAITNSATSVDVLTTGETRWVWTAGFPAEFPFDVRAGGEVWTVTAITPSIYDTFTRTATGWGTADSGQTWTGTGGVAGDHFTQGTRGVHRMTATSSSVRDLITATGTDHDVSMSVSTDQLATGGDQYVAAVARATDENNLYMAQLQFSTAAVVTLTLRKRVAGVETTLGTWSGGVGAAHTALGRFFIRLQVKGSTIRCRAWAAATTEPGLWQIIVTDTSLTTGTAVGARSVRTSGNTNANLLANWDDFELLNPQRFTVTRSVNGVTKTHDAGTDVRLAHPATAAL
ncbi:hypothetical protein [Streptomyces canus]|uniref:hypothetical protein n=1 Tax=Streptomyces canus TaxID=58343 RepID=UPI0033BA1645